MVSIQDIIGFVESLSGHPLNRDEGLHLGQPRATVKNVLVCWMATARALTRAAEVHADLVIGHESLYYPYDAVIRQDNPPGWEDWPVNRLRRTQLLEHRMAFLRVHGSLDEICIFESFRRQLQLPEPACGSSYYIQRYDIPPRPLSDFVQQVKKCTGMARVRVAAPRGMDQQVSHIGLVWGGMGLFVNVSAQAELLKLGCDCLVGGEADDYGFRFCAEAGVPMIETSHELSENAGVEQFSRRLGNRFPELKIAFYSNQCPWQCV